jgi:hypothetical protein
MLKRKLTIIGDAPSRVNAPESDPAHTMCVNNSAHGRYVRYMATLESANCGVHEKFPESNIHPYTEVWGLDVGSKASPRVNRTAYFEPVGGTSSLFTLLVGAYLLGYDEIDIYGVELAPGTIYYDEHVEKNWKFWLDKLKCQGKKITVHDCEWLKGYNKYEVA